MMLFYNCVILSKSSGCKGRICSEVGTTYEKTLIRLSTSLHDVKALGTVWYGILLDKLGTWAAYKLPMDANSSTDNSKLRTTFFKRKFEEALSKLSLSSVSFFLEVPSWQLTSTVPNLYFLLIFQSLHIFHSAIPKFLKQDLVSYIYSANLENKGGSTGDGLSFQCFSRRAILRGFHELLFFVDEESAVPGVHVNFSKKNATADLNWLLKNHWYWSTVRRKNCRIWGSVFPFEPVFIDRDIGSTRSINC